MIHNKAEWVRWEDSLDSSVSLPRDIFAGNMIIPTLETIKYQVNLEDFIISSSYNENEVLDGKEYEKQNFDW